MGIKHFPSTEQIAYWKSVSPFATKAMEVGQQYIDGLLLPFELVEQLRKVINSIEEIEEPERTSK